MAQLFPRQPQRLELTVAEWRARRIVIMTFSFVATATAIGLFVDGARLPVYLATQGREIFTIWPLVLIATVGGVIGTAFGRQVLGQVPERVFRRVLAVLLMVLGLYMAIASRG